MATWRRENSNLVLSMAGLSSLTSAAAYASSAQQRGARAYVASRLESKLWSETNARGADGDGARDERGKDEQKDKSAKKGPRATTSEALHISDSPGSSPRRCLFQHEVVIAYPQGIYITEKYVKSPSSPAPVLWIGSLNME
ncbi:hypothetical protein AXG93_4170s1110 [Marchantia polymorpha subsp. ruderalis]|uniref:Uncharacterized protein n=2 Tax=Marchantia polymorpha TaxID=3197 RepID=A0A176VL92_MARPO|nr:hypothetical protein AXG93_4170s1110 [Marchantia polymorpha subsp. ruderalis]